MEISKVKNLGVLLWHSQLRIRYYHCNGLGCCYGTGSVPVLGTFICCGHSQKKKAMALLFWITAIATWRQCGITYMWIFLAAEGYPFKGKRASFFFFFFFLPYYSQSLLKCYIHFPFKMGHTTFNLFWMAYSHQNEHQLIGCVIMCFGFLLLLLLF